MIMGKVFIRCLLVVAIFLGAIVHIAPVEAQKAGPFALNRPFEPAEELFYEAEFSRAILRNLDIADFKFKALRVPGLNDQTSAKNPTYTLTFNADVTSKGFFTRLFNLNFHERVESTVDPSSFTIQRTLIQDEQGKRIRLTESNFDREKGKLSWTLRDPNNPSGPPRSSVTDFDGQLQDVLSAIYFLRTKQLEVGKNFEIFVGDGGRVYRVPVKVVENKKMTTVLGKINVVRVDPQLFGPTNLIERQKGEFSIWFTADPKHIPVASRIKTEYGVFDIKLKRAVSNPAK